MVNSTNKRIIHITPFYPPNIGGVETYLHDLIHQTSHHHNTNIVITYSPLTTSAPYKVIETRHNTKVYRLPHLGMGLFYRLEKHPLLNFLYLTPYLFFASLIYLVFHRRPHLIYVHGLNAAFIGAILKKVFHLPLFVNLYSHYDNVPFAKTQKKLFVHTLNQADYVFTQSKLSIRQLHSMGINQHKLKIYHHWIDLTRFRPINNKVKLRRRHKLPDRFTILFVGRLIPTKNALLVAKLASHFPDCNFLFVGHGPQETDIRRYQDKYPNIFLYPQVPYSQLHHYYQISDLFLFPTQGQEGWGRVAMEAIACGLPVIASNRGAIPENLDSTVSLLVTPSFSKIKQALGKLINHPHLYHQIAQNTRPYALKHYSSRNSLQALRYLNSISASR